MKRVAFFSSLTMILLILSATSFAQTLPADIFTESEHDFGEVNIGEVQSLDIIIQNNGGELAKVTKITVTGANADEFTITEGGTPFEVKGGETHKMVVTFAPKAEGPRSASWEIEFDSPYSPFMTTLKGTGKVAEVPLKPGKLEPDSDTVNFGEVLRGSQSEMSLIVTNTGEQDLVISNANIAGEAKAEFVVVEGGAPFTVTPGMTHEVKFMFTPTVKGERKAEIAFEQEGNTLPYIITLTGMCILAPPAIAIDNNIVEFGTIKVGQTAEHTVTISNTGDDDLVVNQLMITGPGAANFAVKSGAAPFTVKKGETHQITFSFSPTVAGDWGADVEIYNNYAMQPDLVYLSGTGEAAMTTKPDDTGQTQNQTQTTPMTDEEKFEKNLLQGPLSFSHLNGLWALSGYGAMEWTGTTPEGMFYTTLSLKTATFSKYNDNEDFDATLTFLEIMGRYGIMDNLEAGLKLRLGGWTGTILVPGLPADSEGSFSLGDMFLTMKYNAVQKDAQVLPMPYEMSALLQLKLPVGSQDDALGTGGLDISLNLLNTMYFSDDKLAAHVMLGFTYALDGDQIETDQMLWGFLMNWGVGVNYLVMESQDMSIAVIWQLEFYDPNLDTTIGGRANISVGGLSMTPELGLTMGLHKLSADMEIYFSFGLLF